MAEPKTNVSNADPELLLAEGDRDHPILRTPRQDGEPHESLNSQILAGLVSP